MFLTGFMILEKSAFLYKSQVFLLITFLKTLFKLQ